MDLSNLGIEDIKKRLESEKDDAMLHYYLAKKLFSSSLNQNSVEEIEKELDMAIKLAPKLYMAHYYLGRLYFIQKEYDKAEKEFEKVLKTKHGDLLAKEYLTRCNSLSNVPANTARKSIRDIFYLFENDIRCLIERELTKRYGEDWLRNSVPQKIRALCAARREEGLGEEKDSNLINFANFNDYNLIIAENKAIFGHFLNNNLKLWQERLKELEPVRNAIAHSRNISDDAEKKVREYYKEFKKGIT